MYGNGRCGDAITNEPAETLPDAEGRVPKPIAWMRSLESGSVLIDQEHLALIDQCNALTSLASRGIAHEVFEATIGALSDDLARHFANEEALLLATGFERLSSHMRDHRRICARMQGIQGRAMAATTTSARIAVAREVRELLLDVLLRHDLDYKSHLQLARGDRASPEQGRCDDRPY